MNSFYCRRQFETQSMDKTTLKTFLSKFDMDLDMVLNSTSEIKIRGFDGTCRGLVLCEQAVTPQTREGEYKNKGNVK